MSADDWAICPRCVDEAKAEQRERFESAREAYGQVTPDEYERLRAEAQVTVDPEDFRTFREDYEFYGASEGKVVASYSGHCSKCNLGLDFTHERPFYEREPVTT